MNVLGISAKRLPAVEILLVIFAWTGNALYAFGQPDGALKYWSPALVAVAMISFMFVHGGHRYGLRKIWLFIATVFLIGWCFENVSVITGIPFGGYHYTHIMEPFIGHVPVFVLPAYCVMGYVSWALATLLLQPFTGQNEFVKTFTLPVVAAALMVIWDLSMDPLRATVEQRWIWLDGGAHYGVPILNYFGWFLVTWLMFQVFSLLDNLPVFTKRQPPVADEMGHSLAVPLMYCAFAVEYLLNPFADTAGARTALINGKAVPVQDIFNNIALLSATTMLPLAVAGGLMVLLSNGRPFRQKVRGKQHNQSRDNY